MVKWKDLLQVFFPDLRGWDSICTSVVVLQFPEKLVSLRGRSRSSRCSVCRLPGLRPHGNPSAYLCNSFSFLHSFQTDSGLPYGLSRCTMYDDHCNVSIITNEAETLKTEKRAPNQDKLSCWVMQVQENVTLTPLKKEKIISLMWQYGHTFATEAEDP